MQRRAKPDRSSSAAVFRSYAAVAIAGALVLSWAVPADAARTRLTVTKRHANTHWRGYGFLPGYVQPPSNSDPLAPSRSYREYFYHGPYVDYWGRTLYGAGGPGFYRGRYNGGTFGPCWTRTPIGPMWNCG